MHQPRPHGRFYYGEGELGAEDAAAAELLVRRLTNFKAVSDLETLKAVRTLPSGATAVATDAGGALRLLVYGAPKPPPPPEGDGLVHAKIPMLFSGVISTIFAPPDRPIKVKMTETTIRRLRQYGEDSEIQIKSELMRFNCRLPDHLIDFQGMSGLGPVMTQYTRIRPGWWSGAMAEVAQIVGGYGSQDFENLPEDPTERAVMRLPERYRLQIERELPRARLPAYLGIAPKDGRFRFNFRPYDTNGITFDGSGAPWLTKVSRKGVYAMPLPVIPATTTQAFREYIEKVGDTEILWALDRFGGLPSGETFPSAEGGIEAWERAGAIIKICDADDFFDHDSMSTVCGWSFNTDGTEGFNTATGFDPGAGIPYCAGFKLRLSFGAAHSRGWVRAKSLESGIQQPEVDRYIAELLTALAKNGDRERAIKYKLYRVEPGQVVARARNNGAQDVDYWDNLVLPPIASHKGSCSRVSRGWIYPTRLGAFKVPEPVFEGCISHSVQELYDVKIPEKYPQCDTIIFGYYIGDALKVIKYFSDDREVEKEVESNLEDCMAVGTWTEKRYTSPPRIAGNLYTTDFDEREELAETYTLTTITGTDLGYPSRPSMTFHAYFWRDATITRNRYSGRVTNVKRYIGKQKSVYCYVPFMMRDAAVYGSRERATEMRESEEARRIAFSDPNTYRAWTYDFVWHWASFDMDTRWMDTPQPSDEIPPNIFWVELHEYRDRGACSDWADSGQYIEGLPADYTWLLYADLNGNRALLRNPEIPPSYREYKIPEKKADPDEKHKNFVSLVAVPRNLSDKEVSDFHFSGSPDAFRNVFYQDAAKVFAGSASYANLSDSGGQGVERIRYGFTRVADHKTAHHFIGVINE